MNKRINSAKLKAMGAAKVKAVCIHHAECAIEFTERGDKAKVVLHCNLLDQCAAIARELKGYGHRR